MPSHRDTIILNGLEIILPEVPLLNQYLRSEKEKLEIFQKKFSIQKNQIEMNKRGFPSYFPILNLPKSSYIHEYIVSGKLEKVIECHCVSENKLWYAMKEMRYILDAVAPLFIRKSNATIKAFRQFSSIVDKRFFDIQN